MVRLREVLDCGRCRSRSIMAPTLDVFRVYSSIPCKVFGFVPARRQQRARMKATKEHSTATPGNAAR